MIKRVAYENVIFDIETDNNSLYKMFNNSEGKPNVFIPHILPEGDRIDTLTDEFTNDWFHRITIDDDITVQDHAFYFAHVKEVVWPTNCTTIPTGCFLNSDIEKITNIQNVTQIEEAAFKGTSITEFEWPSGCTEIPWRCFGTSSIERLLNTDNITQVGEYAFEFCRIGQFKWPSKCRVIPKGCFFSCPIKSITNIENVLFIGSEAFRSVDPSFSVDLSQTMVSEIEQGAFLFCKKSNIVMPYYISEEKANMAFRMSSEELGKI